jgi:hypothetical protein
MSFNDSNKLTKLHIWLLKHIFKRAVIQSHDHKNNIELIFKLLRESARAEFTEDNDFTLNCFMQERFESSQFHLKDSFQEDKEWAMESK